MVEVTVEDVVVLNEFNSESSGDFQVDAEAGYIELKEYIKKCVVEDLEGFSYDEASEIESPLWGVYSAVGGAVAVCQTWYYESKGKFGVDIVHMSMPLTIAKGDSLTLLSFETSDFNSKTKEIRTTLY